MGTKRLLITGWRLCLLALLASALSLGFNGRGCNLTDDSNSGSSTVLIIKANSPNIIRDHDSNPDSEINVPAEAVDSDTEVAFIPFHQKQDLPEPLPDSCEFLGGANLKPKHQDKVDFNNGKEADCYVILPDNIRVEELSTADIRLIEFIDGRWVIVLPNKKGKIITTGPKAGYIGPDESAPAKLTGIRPFCWAIIKDPAIILSLYNLWLTISTTTTTGGTIPILSIPSVLNTNTTTVQPVMAQPTLAVIIPPPSPSAAVWTPKANMPTGLASFDVGVVNNKIYAISGSTNLEYNPATNSWAIKAATPTPRTNAAVAVINNKIYVMGGWTGESVYSNKNEEYDPALDTWTTKADMPVARSNFTCGVVNNKIYAIGGMVYYATRINRNDEYDPNLNRWTQKVNMPTARSHFACGVIGDKIYALGGVHTGYDDLGNNEEYDATNNTWATKASMPTARHWHAIGVINNKIYAIGGCNEHPPSNVNSINEEYNPATDSWTKKTSMPTPNFAIAIGATNDRIYTMGGGINNTLNNGAAQLTYQYNPFLDQ